MAALTLIGRPPIETLPDGRRRISRRYSLTGTAAEVAALGTPASPGSSGAMIAWGTADVEFTTLRLVRQNIEAAGQNAGEQHLVRVYEEISATTEVQVAQNAVTYDENGRRVVQAQFIQFTAGSFTPGTVGSTTAPGDTGVVLSQVQATDDGTLRTITRSYVQATSTLVQIGSDSIDTEINGLRRRTQLFIGTAAASDPSGTVGTTTHGTDTTLILASKKVERTATLTRAQVVWLEPGIISKSKSGGPASLPNTLSHSWTTWATVPTMPGIVLSISEGNFQGLKTLVYESLSLNDAASTPIATLATYRDTVRVTKPGEVHIAKHTFSAGKEVPYLVTTPPTTGVVEMAVTVELVTTAPTSIVPVAYNLDGLSVGVCTKRITESPLGYEEGTSITVSVYTDRARIDYDVLRGYYYTDPGAFNGDAITYTYNAQIIRDTDNIIGETLTATETSVITLTGSTGYSAPATGDIYEKRVDPVFTLANGTQVYRVVTYKIP
jgi:hypothetical protein